MSNKVIDLACPSCGAPANTGDKSCNYCTRPIIVSTFTSVQEMSLQDVNKYARSYQKAIADNPDNVQINNSIGMCYLMLKLYDKACAAFEKAIENDIDNSETFFYAAVSLLNGKKAFLTPRPVIDKIEQYINAAIMIEPKGIYHYFHAYIKYDYFSRKFYNTSPTYQELLSRSQESGLSEYDVEQLFKILSVERPNLL